MDTYSESSVVVKNYALYGKLCLYLCCLSAFCLASLNDPSITVPEDFSLIDSEEKSRVETPPTLNQVGISEISQFQVMTQSNQVLPISKFVSSKNLMTCSQGINVVQIIHVCLSVLRKLAESNDNQTHQDTVSDGIQQIRMTFNHTKVQYQMRVIESFPWPVTNIDISFIGLVILSQYFLPQTNHSDRCVGLHGVPSPNSDKCCFQMDTEVSTRYKDQRINLKLLDWKQVGLH